MEIKIVNNIAGAKISMDKAADNTVVITVEEQIIRLGDVKPGTTVKIGGREYIVLDHSKDTTAVITKDFWRSIEPGDSGNYAESAVRNALNKEFLSEVSSAIGVESIIEHEVDLLADDGTNKGVVCRDNVSLLTTDLYRKYRDFLPAYGSWWWTATPYSTEFPRGVCSVDDDGTLLWSSCGYSRGVRPFLILDSSVSNFSVLDPA